MFDFLSLLGANEDKFSQNIEAIYEYASDAFYSGKVERQIYPGKHGFSE